MMNEAELCDQIDKLMDGKVLGTLTEEELVKVADLQRQLGLLEIDKSAVKVEARQVIKKRMRKINKQFKRDEDWGNAQLGLERQGHMRRGLAYPDGVDAMFSVEYTRTKQALAYIRGKMSEAIGHATELRVPIVVIFQDGYKRSDAVVVLRFRDFKELHENERI